MYDPTQTLTPMTANAFMSALESGTTSFTNVDLSNQHLSFSMASTALCFENCCFDLSTFSGSPPSASTFTDCSLRSVSASGTNFVGCTFSSCTFGAAGSSSNADLGEVRGGSWADNSGPFSTQYIEDLSAERCDLAGSAITRINSSTFTACQLNNVQFSLVTDCTFTGCGMKTASLTISGGTVTATDCILDASTITGTESPSLLRGAGCGMREVAFELTTDLTLELTQCLLLSASWIGTTLRGRLVGCDLRDANLSQATLLAASPEAGVAGGFEGCSFAGANLTGATLSGPFNGCTFNAANLQHTAQGRVPPTFSRCAFVFTDLTNSGLPSVADTTDPVVPTVSISSPATSTGGIITGRVSSAGDNTLLTVSALSRLTGSNNWQFVSSSTPRQDGTFLTRAPTPSGAGTLDAVAVVVMRGTAVFSGGALPPVSTDGQGVVAVASASTVPAGRAALELGSARPQVTIPALTGDFTLSAWLTFPDPTVQQGLTVALLAIEGGAASLRVAAGPDGAITARLGAGTSSDATLQTGPTALRDGSWHHVAVVRQDGALSLLLDGLPLDATAGGGAATSTVGGAGCALRLGWSGSETLGETTLSDMSGGLDELSLRGAALRPADVRRTMYLPVAASESLLGWWSFNAQTGAADAPEGTAAVAASTGALSFLTDTLPFTPADQPYLVVQQQLLRDVGYAPDDPDQTPAEIPAFHLVISARSAVDLPQWLDLEVALADVPEGPDTLAVLRHETLLTLTSAPTTFTLNTAGSLSLVVPPVQGALVAPMLKVRAPFMADGEWVVVALDRHLHWKLGSLTPETLASTWAVSQDVADAFAPAIAALGSGCYEHDIASNHPVLRPAGTSGDTRVSTPGARRYESPLITRSAFNPSNQVSTTDVVTDDAAVERIGQLESLTAPHFSLTCTDGEWSFQALTEDEGTEQLARVQVKGVGSLAELFPSGGRRVAAGTARDTLGLDATSVDLGELYTEAATSDQIVVTRRTVVDEDTSVRVSTMVALVALPDGGGWTYATLTTVPQLIGLAQVLLQRVQGLAVSSSEAKTGRARLALVQNGRGGVIALDTWDDMELVWDLADAFDWDAITASFEVIWSFIDKGVTWIQTQIDDVLVWVKSQLAGMAAAVDSNLDALVAKLGRDSMKTVRATSTSSDPLPIDATKISRALQDGASEIDMDTPDQPTVNAPTSSLNLGALSAALTSTASGFGSMDRLFKEGLATVVTLCKDLLNGVVTALEAGVDAVRALIDDFFSMFNDTLDTHIDIPVITWLYENWLMDDLNHHKLKGKSLMALLVAVPFTLMDNLITGKNPFGSDPEGHKVTDAIDEIQGFLNAHSFSAATPNLPTYSGSMSLAVAPQAREAGSSRGSSTTAWTIFGGIATAIAGECVAISGVCAVIPLSGAQLVGVVASTLNALFSTPLWGIALTSGALQWTAFGLNVGAWACSSVVTTILDWILMLPNMASWFLGALKLVASAGSTFERLLTNATSFISNDLEEVLQIIGLVTSLPKAILGLAGLGLAIAGDTLLLVDNQLPSTALKMVADILYNVGILAPGVSLVIATILTEGGTLSSPVVTSSAINALALVPLTGSAYVYITQAGTFMGGH